MENVSPFWSFCSLPRIVESWRVQENYHESFLQTNSISWSCLKPMEVFVCSIYFFKTFPKLAEISWKFYIFRIGILRTTLEGEKSIWWHGIRKDRSLDRRLNFCFGEKVLNVDGIFFLEMCRICEPCLKSCQCRHISQPCRMEYQFSWKAVNPFLFII